MQENRDDDIHQLKAQLEKERCKSQFLSDELAILKQQQLKQHVEIEQEEEFITNKLLKSLRSLEQEKNQILMDIDREQEYLTNTLQRRMAQIQQEKNALEKQLKAEQDYIEKDLQKKIEQARSDRNAFLFESSLQQEVLNATGELAKLLSSIRESASRDSQIHVDVDKTSQLVFVIEKRVSDYERYLAEYRERTRNFQVGIKKLEDENFLLKQKIERQAELSLKISQEKARLEHEQETSIERQYHAAKKSENPHDILKELTQKLSGTSSPRNISRSTSLSGREIEPSEDME